VSGRRLLGVLGGLVVAGLLAGCAEQAPEQSLGYPAVPIGPAPRFQPAPSVGPHTSCRPRRQVRALAHVELFAAGRVVIIPARLGRGTHCTQALFTTEPTGVILITRDGLTLGDLFAIWRQPLSATRMLSFRGRVRAYVAGRRWRGAATAVPLRPHAQIVLEVGPYIRPHPRYLFPPISAFVDRARERGTSDTFP
jgi:hypothetical protein